MATHQELLDLAHQIGREVAAPVADEVDREARFPKESMDAMRSAGLLGAMIPVADGGFGADLATVGAMVRAMAHSCSSTAMIFAMHQIQVACLVNHERNAWLDGFIKRVAAEQLILASATTELGVGGDTRSSICAVEIDGERFQLEKLAPVVSYGEFSDAVLATARRSADSPPSDQCLVICERAHTVMEPRGAWDALGFRGTCSIGFRLVAQGPIEAVAPTPYADILGRTMLPVSHILWSSLWLGIAEEAMTRATKFIQSAARSKPGTIPPGATRLAEASGSLQSLEALVLVTTARYLELAGDEPGPIDAVKFNNLKVVASTEVVDIVGKAMHILGMAGYRQDSPLSLGRLLRDAHGAAVMVNNDRITGNTASLVLLQRSR